VEQLGANNLISDFSENKNDSLKSYKKASKNFKSSFEKYYDDKNEYQTHWVRGEDSKFVKETFFRLFFLTKEYTVQKKTILKHFMSILLDLKNSTGLFWIFL
jgi:hypothetical protein